MKPCRACGGTDVVRTVINATLDPAREWVIVTCAGCEARRNGYYRKKTSHA